MFCTYLYCDPKSGIWRYVGKGILRRPYSHVKNGSHNSQLHNMLKKRMREGFSPRPIVLSASSEADATEMEVLLIAMLGRFDLSTGTLFNLTDGGEGCQGRKASLEERQRASLRHRNMSAEKKEQKSQKISAANSGRVLTPEQRKAKGKKGKIMSESAKLKLSKPCTVDGITIYSGFRQLVSALGRGKTGARSPTFRYIQKDE